MHVCMYVYFYSAGLHPAGVLKALDKNKPLTKTQKNITIKIKSQSGKQKCLQLFFKSLQ